MAEGVSHSVIAKQEQTISQENSLLILLKLSLIPCCVSKNFGVILYQLLLERNRMQVKIFSLSPGPDIMCTTCIFEKPKQQKCVFGNMPTFFTLQSFRSVSSQIWYRNEPCLFRPVELPSFVFQKHPLLLETAVAKSWVPPIQPIEAELCQFFIGKLLYE